MPDFPSFSANRFRCVPHRAAPSGANSGANFFTPTRDRESARPLRT